MKAPVRSLESTGLYRTLAAGLRPLRQRARGAAKFLADKQNRPELAWFLVSTTTVTLAAVGFGTMALASADAIQIPLAMEHAKHVWPMAWGSFAGGALLLDLAMISMLPASPKTTPSQPSDSAH